MGTTVSELVVGASTMLELTFIFVETFVSVDVSVADCFSGETSLEKSAGARTR